MKRLKKSLKIYLSGAISGTNDYVERFAKAERLLKEHGDIVVLNPVNNSGKNYAEFMEGAMRMLKDADAVFLVEDYANKWLVSDGVCFELIVAEKLKIPVFYRAGHPYKVNFCKYGHCSINSLFEEVEENE